MRLEPARGSAARCGRALDLRAIPEVGRRRVQARRGPGVPPQVRGRAEIPGLPRRPVSSGRPPMPQRALLEASSRPRASTAHAPARGLARPRHRAASRTAARGLEEARRSGRPGTARGHPQDPPRLRPGAAGRLRRGFTLPGTAVGWVLRPAAAAGVRGESSPRAAQAERLRAGLPERRPPGRRAAVPGPPPERRRRNEAAANPRPGSMLPGRGAAPAARAAVREEESRRPGPTRLCARLARGVRRP